MLCGLLVTGGCIRDGNWLPVMTLLVWVSYRKYVKFSCAWIFVKFAVPVDAFNVCIYRTFNKHGVIHIYRAGYPECRIHGNPLGSNLGDDTCVLKN